MKLKHPFYVDKAKQSVFWLEVPVEKRVFSPYFNVFVFAKGYLEI